jgi:quinolinate synthase
MQDQVKEIQIKEIEELKRERNAVIVAHNYQPDSVQAIADYIGDSFGLSKKAAELEEEVIVFCGVKFMAESAKIVSPEKTVLIPEINAGCPMADMAELDKLKEVKGKHPEAAVVSYVNSSAAIKSESDICCTSSNAVKIVNSLPHTEIIFLPDKNLGDYVSRRTDKKIIFWEGFCPTHHRVGYEDIKEIRELYAGAPILAHPECRAEVLAEADFIGSTAGILDYARRSDAERLIIGTEMGLMYRLKAENPEKEFELLSPQLICKNMKKTNLNKIVSSLKNMETEIEIAENTRLKAAAALEAMIEIGDSN